MRRRRASGFSLIELLISVAITLIVMAIVFQLSRQLQVVYRAEARAVERTAGALRTLDELSIEIARAGYGLGDGVLSVLPCPSDDGPSASCIVLRSNPEGVGTRLTGELRESGLPVPVLDGSGFESGCRVLVVDRSGATERAEVVDASAQSIRLRSLEGPDGAFLHPFSASNEARVLKLKETQFRLEDEGRFVKDEGAGGMPLSDFVEDVEFEYLDGDESALALEKVERGFPVAAVRIRLHLVPDELNPKGRPSYPPTLVTAVDLDQQSVSVDFEDRVPGLILNRVLYPLERPVGVLSRQGAQTGVVLVAGKNPYQEPASLFSFWLRKSLTMAELQRENVVFLDDVRRPVAACFGPEGGPFAGSLFLAAWGLRRGHLTRVYPDGFGVLSQESRVATFDGTEALAMVGGMTFGIDNSLYLTGEENGGVFRIGFDESGRPRGGPEDLARIQGSPGAMALGADGSLYFVVNRGKESVLVKLGFDETLSPKAPVEVGSLRGRTLSLAADPLSTLLYALVGDERGDAAVVEISPSWIRTPQERQDPLPEIFRWSSWLRDREQGKLPLLPQSPMLPDEAVPQKLDFLGFDHTGALYLGSSEMRTVLRFDFNRPGLAERYAVGVTSTVEGGDVPRVKLQTWKKSVLP